MHLSRKVAKNNSGQYLVYVARAESLNEWEIERIFYRESSAKKYIKEVENDKKNKTITK